MLLPTLEWLVALLMLETLSEECCLRIRRSVAWALPFPGEQRQGMSPTNLRVQSCIPKNASSDSRALVLRARLWAPPLVLRVLIGNIYTLLFPMGFITLHVTNGRHKPQGKSPNTSSLRLDREIYASKHSGIPQCKRLHSSLWPHQGWYPGLRNRVTCGLS